MCSSMCGICCYKIAQCTQPCHHYLLCIPPCLYVRQVTGSSSQNRAGIHSCTEVRLSACTTPQLLSPLHGQAKPIISGVQQNPAPGQRILPPGKHSSRCLLAMHYPVQQARVRPKLPLQPGMHAWCAGMYVQQERYPWYYGGDIDRTNFFDNSVLSSPPSARTNSFEPSVSQRTLINSIDFPSRVRDLETRIYRSLIVPTSHTAGKVIFRLTSDDASHLILDGAVAIDNGGGHGPVTKHHGRTLKKGEPVQFEVQILPTLPACGSSCGSDAMPQS